MATDDRSEDLREAAAHRGLKLVKSRRRKPGSGDYGLFGLIDADGKKLLGFDKDRLTATADEITAYLGRATAANSWAESARTTPARARSVVRPEAPPREVTDALPSERTSATRTERPRRAVEHATPPPAPAASLVLRKAKPTDAAAIAHIFGGKSETVTASMRGKGSLLVADRGGIIGCVAWHLIPTPQHGIIGRITLIAVAQDAQRQGIGTALMAAARAALAKQRCVFIEVMSDIEVRNAHGFFRAMGFGQHSYRFTID